MEFKREKSAGGIVYRIEKSGVVWLLVQLTAHKGWGFPKGHVGDMVENESDEQAALREVKEEGGITTKIVRKDPIKIGYMFRRENFLIRKTVVYYLMEYVSGDIKDHDWEVADIRFLPEDEARKTLSFKSDKEAYEKALEIFHRADGIAP